MLRALLPCLFGLEAALKAEIEAMGFPADRITGRNGQVEVDLSDNNWREELYRLNLWSRIAERVRLELFTGEAHDFDQFFDTIEAFAWEDWIEPKAAFDVNGSSLKSKLYGIPSLQGLAKKAIVNRLMRVRKVKGDYLEEDPEVFQHEVYFALNRNQLSVSLDTSGEGLHKRGYRPLTHLAPLRETTASGILFYSFYERYGSEGEKLYDPFCGSGTFLIEGAMLLADKAPGLDRTFSLDGAHYFDPAIARELKAEAAARFKPENIAPGQICGSDVQGKVLQEAGKNIRRAGFEKSIELRQRDITQLTPKGLLEWPGAPALILANPPYGERLMTENQALGLTLDLVDLVFEDGQLRDDFRLSFLQKDRRVETKRRPADKRRKLYNGSLPVTLFQYFRHGKMRR